MTERSRVKPIRPALERAVDVSGDERMSTGPKVGFLGLGWIGRSRLEAAIATGHLEPSAIADSVPEALDVAGALVPRAVRCHSLDEILERDLDALVIATPSALHADQTLRALERGLSVFCQKPLGRSAAEARSLVDAARGADRLLGVDLSYRHVAGVRAMRCLVQDGEIGDVFAARAVFHNAYGPGKDWFFDPRLSGGGCVIDLGIHLVDLVLWTLAFPKVTAVSSRLYRNGRAFERDGREVEDFATARLDLSNGAVAEIACSWNLSTGVDAVIELEFHGTRGSLQLTNVGGSYFDFVAKRHDGRTSKVLAEPPDDWGGRAICIWAEHLARSPRYDPSIEEVLEVASVLDAIYSGSIENI